MRVSSINTSFIDYPDVTSMIVFMTGCDIKCKGCQNPKLQDPEYGVDVDLDSIVHYYENKPMCKAVVFSGGDPLYQFEDLLKACIELKGKGAKICIYTGECFNNVPKILFNHIDLLITEPYVEQLGPLSSPTTNQKCWDIIDSVPVENCSYFKEKGKQTC